MDRYRISFTFETTSDEPNAPWLHDQVAAYMAMKLAKRDLTGFKAIKLDDGDE